MMRQDYDRQEPAVPAIARSGGSSVFHSMGGDFVLWESGHGRVPVKTPCRLAYFCAIYCERGQISVTADGRSSVIPARKMYLLRPDTVLESYRYYPGTKFILIMMRPFTIMRHIFVDDDVWKLNVFAAEHPLLDMPPGSWPVLHQYVRLVKATGSGTARPYDSSLMQNLISNVIYGTLNIIASNAEGRLKDFEQRPGYNLFMRFLDLVSHGKDKLRSVSDAARHLCVSPKHLSRVVSSVSRITPQEWMHSFTLRRALRLLKYSGKTVKEISEELGFPNQSAFGTFIRSKTGKSPSELR